MVGYGETGATKYSILLNGIQQGWAGEATSFNSADSYHPGVRVDGFSTSYSDQAARDITFAASTKFVQNADGSISASNAPVYQTHCALYPQTGSNTTDPYYNLVGNSRLRPRTGA